MSNKSFEYTYSAPTERERREIESIKSQYTEKQDDKLTRLRKLDGKARLIPVTVSCVMGVVGVLIFGLGLTMVLEWDIFVWGCLVMLLGCVPMSTAHLAYGRLFKRSKQKYADEIIKLSDSLLNNTSESDAETPD